MLLSAAAALMAVGLFSTTLLGASSSIPLAKLSIALSSTCSQPKQRAAAHAWRIGRKKERGDD
eukprot:5107143-Pleurochrysis_carterae.AAC.1